MVTPSFLQRDELKCLERFNVTGQFEFHQEERRKKKDVGFSRGTSNRALQQAYIGRYRTVFGAHSSFVRLQLFTLHVFGLPLKHQSIVSFILLLSINLTGKEWVEDHRQQMSVVVVAVTHRNYS